MTQVRLRHEDEGSAKLLGDVPFDQLDSVIPTIKSWGLYAEDIVDTDGLFAQFVYGDDGAYFEVAFS
jgi:hypothetical protein